MTSAIDIIAHLLIAAGMLTISILVWRDTKGV